MNYFHLSKGSLEFFLVIFMVHYGEDTKTLLYTDTLQMFLLCILYLKLHITYVQFKEK